MPLLTEQQITTFCSDRMVIYRFKQLLSHFPSANRSANDVVLLSSLCFTRIFLISITNSNQALRHSVSEWKTGESFKKLSSNMQLLKLLNSQILTEANQNLAIANQTEIVNARNRGKLLDQCITAARDLGFNSQLRFPKYFFSGFAYVLGCCCLITSYVSSDPFISVDPSFEMGRIALLIGGYFMGKQLFADYKKIPASFEVLECGLVGILNEIRPEIMERAVDLLETQTYPVNIVELPKEIFNPDQAAMIRLLKKHCEEPSAMCGICRAEEDVSKEEKQNPHVYTKIIRDKIINFLGPYHQTCLAEWEKTSPSLVEPLSGCKPPDLVTTPRKKHFIFFRLPAQHTISETDSKLVSALSSMITP